MKKIILATPIIAVLLVTSLAQEKAWTEWTKADADKMLNNSPWSQTQTETDTSEMMYSPTSQAALGSGTRSGVVGGQSERQSINSNRASQGALNQAISVNYYVRLLSAKPVRQAFMRLIELTQKDPDQKLRRDLQAFVDRDFGEYIAVAVSFDSTDGRYSGPALQAFNAATLGTLKTKTYLERKDGKRVFLMDYYTPINDGIGAKFIFPRIVDEQPFIKADSGSFRFFAEVGQIKLNVTFKTPELMYNGQLEY